MILGRATPPRIFGHGAHTRKAPHGKPIAGWTARDIATHCTYSKDRVRLHVVDESTVLAVGFAAWGCCATGRVAWILRDPGSDVEESAWWHERRCRDQQDDIIDPLADGPTSAWYLHTDDDLDALVRWLRGEA